MSHIQIDGGSLGRGPRRTVRGARKRQGLSLGQVDHLGGGLGREHGWGGSGPLVYWGMGCRIDVRGVGGGVEVVGG